MASPRPITAGIVSATLSDARTWKTMAPNTSSASPIAAATPIGGHDQADQHTGDAGELERSYHPPLRRLDAQMVADRQRLPKPDNLDQAGKPEKCRKQCRHDHLGDHDYTVMLSP